MLRALTAPWRATCTCRPAQLPTRAAHTRPASTQPAPPPPPFRPPTIFAPATGKGKSAISILRVSGPDALEVWRTMTLPARGRTQSDRTRSEPPERKAVLRRIVAPDGEVLDEAVVLYFPCACRGLAPSSAARRR